VRDRHAGERAGLAVRAKLVGKRSLGTFLAVVQTSFATMVTVASVFLLGSFVSLQRVDLGFESRSFDDFGYQIQRVFNRRRNGLERNVTVGFGDDIVAQTLRYILRMRHRRDARCVHRLHRCDQIENGVEPGLRDAGFQVADFDAGKAGNAFDVVRT